MQLQGFNGIWLILLEVKQRLLGNYGNPLAQLMAEVANLSSLPAFVAKEALIYYS
jgi:hypothetical protein